MSNLSVADKHYLESALRMSDGYVLSFSDSTFTDFFSILGININDPKYLADGTSKAKRLRTFWQLEDNEIVGRTIIEFAGLIRNQELAGYINKLGFSENVEKIGKKLLEMTKRPSVPQSTSAIIKNNRISIEIRPEIYEHIKRYLDVDDYFQAVSEAYKVVRKKLHEKTGKEKADDVFNNSAQSDKYHLRLFGQTAETGTPKSDFFRGIGYIHLAVQFLRNEKAHSLADDLDKNLAIHYLSLASLAYDLISKNDPNEVDGVTLPSP